MSMSPHGDSMAAGVWDTPKLQDAEEALATSLPNMEERSSVCWFTPEMW